MSKRVAYSLLAFVVLILGVMLLGRWWLFPAESGPDYQGQKLSYWLGLYAEEAYCGGYRGGGLDEVKASLILREAGTNALPFLLSRMRSKDSPVSRLKGVLWRKQSLIKFKYASADTLKFQAVNGILALGPAAEGAIPELARLLNEQETAIYAAMALAGVGGKSMPALLGALSNSSPRIRAAAAYGLGGGLRGCPVEVPVSPIWGTNTSVVIDALIQTVKDPNADVRAAAFRALGILATAPEIVLPILQEGARDPAAECRSAVAGAFLCFGTNLPPTKPRN